MKFILSLAGLAIVSSYFLTGKEATLSITAGAVLIGICLVGLLFYSGKAIEVPYIGQSGFIGNTKVTVLHVFNSYFDIPESIKGFNSDPLLKEADMKNYFVIGGTRQGKVIISPYFKPNYYVSNKQQNQRSDRRNISTKKREKHSNL